MNYLSRPVFEFPVNWASSVNRSFTYDLREVAPGFGTEVFTGRGLYVINGWGVQCELATEQEIYDFDAFFAALLGRLQGFWFPVPMLGMEIVAAVSATEFDIRDQGLRNSWTNSPDIHLYFSECDVAQAAKIIAVTLVGSNERVTIDAALSQAPIVNTSVFRMHYVRLSDDAEKATFVQELHQQRSLRLVELPNEYATAETGERPIYLYHFWMAAPVDYHWYYTSFAAAVVSENHTHSAAQINHGVLSQSVRFQSESVELEAAYLLNHPLSLFLPIPSSRPMNIQIKQCFYSDPDTVTTLFTGIIRKVEDRGILLSAQCDNFLSILKQRIPSLLIKPDCGYQVFDPRTCKAILASFQTSGLITAIDNEAQPPTIELQLRFPSADRQTADWFAQGWLETGRQLGFELRTIFASLWDAGTARLTVTTNAPLQHAIIGQEIQLIPGCDGLAATCQTKFNNFVNFGGFVDIPDENPSLKAIDNIASAGDKK